MSEELDNEKNKGGLSRRDVLKGLATVPVLGALAYSTYKKKQHDNFLKENILNELDLPKNVLPASNAKTHGNSAGNLLRLGIIGFGIRGEQLVRASGFATPSWSKNMQDAAAKNKQDKRWEEFARQESLNIQFTGVCDLFDFRAEEALASVGKQAKRYRNYQDMLASNDIDAVIIATPDHWHAQMVIDAANAGKHVYVEKCMTRTIDETYKLVEAVKKNKVTFQLGHQHRQNENYFIAKELIRKNVLGPITLIQTTTNRNDPNGAWVYPIHEQGSPETIDWKQFTGTSPERPFDLDRFFRWRKYWDYGTGLSGDLLTHEFDTINYILELGIPKSATASGGVYFFKDGREVPDVLQVSLEFPDRNLTFLYSASLASGYNRPTVIMGHDASMELGATLTVNPEPSSTRYKEKIEQKIIDPSLPLYSYQPGSKNVDAITSATSKYFASKGYLYTYRNGKRVDSTHLHIKDWLDCIRHGGTPICNEDQGFMEAISAHMATMSYLTGKTIHWDHANNRLAEPEQVDMAKVLASV